MLEIKRNMNNVIYDRPIYGGVIIHSECTTLLFKTDILHTVVLTDPPDRVVMRSAISQRARPRAGGSSTRQSVQTLAGGSASATSSPLSFHTSTQNNTAVFQLKNVSERDEILFFMEK